MGDKNSSLNFPRSSSRSTQRRSAYNTPGYYHANRSMAEARQQADETEHVDNYARQDYTGQESKYENYQADGYYGSNYGNINRRNIGRDYEQNAGYRDSYSHLTTGQWPEVERARDQRRSMETPRQQPEGPHRGKGPKSYKRSDTRILEDVNDVLCEDPYIDASDIEARVENGEVVLTGFVQDKFLKRRAEDLLDQVSGINNVENRLRTRVPGENILNVRNTGG